MAVDTRSPQQPMLRAAERIHQLAAWGLGFVLVSLPFWLSLVALIPDASNAPLFAVCALPLAPAFAAVLYSVSHLDTDEAPSRVFLRGLRQGWRQALALWLPVVAAAAVVLVDAGAPARVRGAGLGWLLAVGLVALVAVPWVWLSQIIAAQFAFRTRDVARLALYYTVSRPLVSLALVAVTAAELVLVAWTFDWVPAALASPVALLAVGLARPALVHLRAHFLRVA